MASAAANHLLVPPHVGQPQICRLIWPQKPTDRRCSHFDKKMPWLYLQRNIIILASIKLSQSVSNCIHRVSNTDVRYRLLWKADKVNTFTQESVLRVLCGLIFHFWFQLNFVLNIIAAPTFSLTVWLDFITAPNQTSVSNTLYTSIQNMFCILVSLTF